MSDTKVCMTYGTLPTLDQYQAAFQKNVPGGIYKIRNCRELDAVFDGGNVDLDSDQLWSFLNDCCDLWQDNHEAVDIASGIMEHLGYKWI